MNIRPATITDLPRIREINEAALPHVNSIPFEDFEWFLQHAAFFLSVESESDLAGFMIVLSPGKDYNSPNYTYFKEHYNSFDYVDRIVIHENFRGKKLGSALYRHLFSHSDAPVVSCEVNLKPANPASLKFHKQLGFKEVAQQKNISAGKTVSLMVKEL